MDINKIMQMAGQLQEQMGEAQEKAAKQKFDGEAGGGLVKLVMNGRHEIISLTIDPSLSSDLSLLEDLVRAASNDANRKVAEGMKGQLGGMAQGMGLDLSMLKNLG